MEFRKFWVTMALIGLIAVTLIQFVVQIESDNDQEGQRILGNSLLNKSFQNLQGNLSGFGDTSQGQLESFQSESPTTSFGSLIIFTIVSAGKIFSGMIITVFTILLLWPVTIFGVSSVVASVISAIFLISVVIGLWSLFKIGQ